MTPGQPGNGKTGWGFIQNISVGVGKMMRVELRPLGELGVCFPREVWKFTCPEVEKLASYKVAIQRK